MSMQLTTHISFKISTIIALKKRALNKTENLSLHSIAIIIKHTHSGPHIAEFLW